MKLSKHIQQLLLFLSGLLALVYCITSSADLYDDFDDSDFIDPARWQTPINFSTFIDANKLRIEQFQQGDFSTNNVVFTQPSINSIETRINVIEATSTGGSTTALISGFFCDTDGQANGSTGEILATMGIGLSGDTRVVAISLLLFGR